MSDLLSDQTKLQRINVLLVEDNPGDADLVLEYIRGFKRRGADCKHVGLLADAVEALRDSAQKFDVILFDLTLPDARGIDGLNDIVSAALAIPVIVLTGSEDEELALPMLSSGAQDFLSKRDLNTRELARALFFAVERSLFQLNLKKVISSRAEAQLLASTASVARDQADSANATKSLFLANMSHEIRTPLGIIIGYADLALRKEETETERELFLKGIHRNALHLGRLVNDILDLAKVEAGKFEPEMTSFKFKEFLSEIIHSYSVKAQEKELRLVVEASGVFPEKISSDKLRMTQIITNLLSNAVKFTSQGEIHFKITPGPNDASKRKTIVYEVRDSGIGLSKTEVDQIFKPFSQADSSTTRKYGGTGLGLILARTLARSLGGDLELVSSQREVGSVFSMTLPFEDVPLSELAVHRHQTEDQCLKGLSVLLIDDSIDNQLIIARYLELAGATVDCKNDGDAGSTTALAGTYDLVLMDIQMPVMGGEAATAKLRTEGYTKPIVALTAHAMSDERTRSMALGFSGYLTKPVNVPVLLQTVRKLGFENR